MHAVRRTAGPASRCPGRRHGRHARPAGAIRDCHHRGTVARSQAQGEL